MSERSMPDTAFKEICRWWDCGSERQVEWTREGSCEIDAELRDKVAADGYSTCYKGSIHDGVWIKGAF